MGPAVIAWPPSQYWDGDDGDWSSFALRVGSPGQVCRVLPSTAGQATWVVTPGGCPAGEAGTDPSLTCSQSRGGLYDPGQSKSWHILGNYSLGLESTLGYGDLTAAYGEDTVALGFTDSNGGATLDSQIVAGIETDYYYTGVFGLGNQGTNLTNFTDPRPSFLTTMKAKNLIPSLSWAYTAGARYRSKGVFGSLTFGGYDSSRFVPNNVSFSLASDISRDLVVGLQSITSTTAKNSTAPQSLLPAPILSFIDSTLPYIYLPLEACQAFEQAFGLSWNETAEMYWVNDTVHQALVTANPNITFTIGNSNTGGPTVDIRFPYASFDLEAKNPFVSPTRRYFPLQRAANASQYTLGRTFLQEAYLITDYERSNFSLSQCRFEDGVATDLVKIPSMTKISSRPSPNLIIGTSVGGAVLFILVILTLGFVIQRRRRKQNQTEQFETSSERPSSLEKPRVMTICSVREIDNNSLCGPIRELPDSGKVELLDENKPSGSGNEISEMPPSLTVMAHELRTHRSSKEQSMMRTHSANSFNILKSTSISRKSWTNMDLSDRSPRIETVISASARQKSDLNNRPTSTSPDTAEVSPLSMPKSTGLPDNPSITETDFPETSIPVSLDLNRSLPPTPISESPQVSPNSEGFSRALSLRKGSRNWSTAAGASVSVPDLPMVPASKFSEALRRHRQEGGYHSLKGLETTIPPGHPDLDESDVSAISSDEQILNTTWL